MPPQANDLLGSIQLGTTQITQIATTALGLLTLYRKARDAWKQANPTTTDPFLTDLDLINALSSSAGDLTAEADRLLSKYRDAPPSDPL